MALNRVVQLSSQSSLTGLEYTAYEFTNYQEIQSLVQTTSGFRIPSTRRGRPNFDNHQAWSLGFWPWQPYSPVPTMAYELLAPVPVVFWGRTAEDPDTNLTLLSPPENNRPLQPGHIVIINPDTGIPTVRLSITGTIPVFEESGLRLLNAGYIGGVDESETSDNGILLDPNGDPLPDFALNGTLRIGFSSHSSRQTLTEPRINDVWAEIIETGSQASVTSVGTDLGPAEVEQTATIRTRYDPVYSLAQVIIDDLGRSWNVVGSASMEGRRFIDFECVRVIATEETL